MTKINVPATTASVKLSNCSNVFTTTASAVTLPGGLPPVASMSIRYLRGTVFDNEFIYSTLTNHHRRIVFASLPVRQVGHILCVNSVKLINVCGTRDNMVNGHLQPIAAYVTIA